MGHRVLHVIPAIAPRYGGPSAATFGLCRALRGRGVDTLVATTDADGPGRLDVPLERAGEYHGVPVIFFRRRFSEAFKWTWRLGAWLDAHVTDFDVVHVHAVFSHSSLVAGRACRGAGIPYIVRPLGTLDPWSVSRRDRPARGRRRDSLHQRG
jgi:glycosyltransferase involved in cell wall biosynthesis